jgi:hypothetical protein
MYIQEEEADCTSQLFSRFILLFESSIHQGSIQKSFLAVPKYTRSMPKSKICLYTVSMYTHIYISSCHHKDNSNESKEVSVDSASFQACVVVFKFFIQAPFLLCIKTFKDR